MTHPASLMENSIIFLFFFFTTPYSSDTIQNNKNKLTFLVFFSFKYVWKLSIKQEDKESINSAYMNAGNGELTWCVFTFYKACLGTLC